MTVDRAYKLGVRAAACDVVGRGDRWIVLWDGREVTSGSVFYCARFRAGLFAREVEACVA